MKASQLISLLKTTIPARLPVLIKGAPGIGKTDCVHAAAKACGAETVLMHPVVSDPTDFKGLPAVVKGKAEFLPYGDLEALVAAERPTVAFLDDLGQAPAVVQAAAMQLILARRVNGHKVSDQVVFVAATNRREDRAGVTGILEPVKSRFATIVELTVSVEDWCDWALENGVPPEVVAFVRFRPGLMADPGPATADLVNRPSPRTVTHLGKLYAAGLRDPETLGGAAGAGFGTEFVAFERIFRQLPSIDGILANPERSQTPREPAALYAVVTALATRVNRETAGRVIRYLDRLPDEFSVLGVRDALRVFPAVAGMSEFIKWSVKHKDVLT